MSSFLGHSGTCRECGRFGYVWIDGSAAERGGACDDCHTRCRVRQDYAKFPHFAPQVYCAATADDALLLLGVKS